MSKITLLSPKELNDLLENFRKLSPQEQITVRRQVCEGSPLAFGVYYLAEHFQYDIPQFHKELYTLGQQHPRLAIAAPRSFAKSTIFSFVFPMFWALSGKKKDILIVSSTYSLAEDWLRKIKHELENNKFIHLDYGLVQSDKWTDSHIILKNGSQIRAKGRGYQIRGFRPDVVIIDDIEDDELVRSKEQREKLAEWFWKALINTLEKDSQVVVIGTLMHPESLLCTLLSNTAWSRRRYRALDGKKSLWEAKWSVAALLKRKEEIGIHAFEAEFQNNPQAAVDGIWKSEWFKTWKELPEELYIITTIDPAVSLKEVADYSAINTLGVTTHGEIYNLSAIHGRWSLKEMVDRLIKTWQTWTPQVIWLEEYGFQQALRQYIDEECERQGITLPVRRIELGRDWQKKARDKATRALSVTYLAEQGKVYLGENQKELLDELVVFPYGDHDDLQDAFTYGLMVSQELSKCGEIVGKRKMGAILNPLTSFEVTNETMPAETWDFGKDEAWRYQ